MVIFVVGYRATGRPLKTTFCLVIGLGYRHPPINQFHHGLLTFSQQPGGRRGHPGFPFKHHAKQPYHIWIGQGRFIGFLRYYL